MKTTAIKIAYLGGGSRHWARDLMSELVLTPGLSGSVALYDLDFVAAQKNVAIADAIFSRPEARTRFTVRAVRRLADALRGADFVVLSIEPGPITARHADLEIPAKYGIVQPVGDTTGPGGIVRALRAIPVYADFARQIMTHCPQAWVINYTNPMTLCMAALFAVEPRIKAIGCCHEVFHTQMRLAHLAEKTFEPPRPIQRQEIQLDLTGINHFTWVTGARWKKHELFPLLKKEISTPGFFRSRSREGAARKRQGKYFESSGLIAMDLLRRFDALGAAGDRHLAEFVPWYATDEQALHRWGVPLTPYRFRVARAVLRDHDAAYYAQRPLRASDEEGVRLIEALLGLKPFTTNVNLLNTGQAKDLPLGHVVEGYVHVERNRITPCRPPLLPPGPALLVRRAAEVQQLTLQAGFERDVELAFQAILSDPLVRGPMDDLWVMFKRMLQHLRPHLPGWKIPA